MMLFQENKEGAQCRDGARDTAGTETALAAQRQPTANVRGNHIGKRLGIDGFAPMFA